MLGFKVHDYEIMNMLWPWAMENQYKFKLDIQYCIYL